MKEKKISKRKRNAITFEQKNEVIKLHEKGLSQVEIGKRLNLSRTTVQTIVKDKERILIEIKNGASLKSTIVRKRAGLVAEMEKLLIVWIADQTQRRVPLSLAVIQAKALSLFNTLNGTDENAEEFSASRGWFMRFKARCGLHNISVQGESASADKVAADDFQTEFARTYEDGNYSPKQIFNVDETGLFWKKMPSRTYIAQEEKFMPGFKTAKDRLTLLLGSNASGDFKLKPLLIYRSENPRALKGQNKRKLPVIWKSNKKAWMTGQLFEEWFRDHFVPEVKKYCHSNNLAFKALLLIDNAPGHPPHIVDMDPNVKVVFLPPNTSSLIQPMDQGVIATFKAYYLRTTFAEAISATDHAGGPTLTEFWKKFNILDAINIIDKSWQEVKQTCLNGVWKQVCGELVFDFQGFEDEVKEVAADVVAMGTKLQLDVATEDVHELLDSHSQELTNEDLLELRQQSKAELEEDVQENFNSKRLTTKQLEEAFKNLETAMKIFDECDPNEERNAKTNRLISSAYHCYREIYNEKKREEKQTS